MDFEHAKSPASFIDSMDTSFNYLDSGLDYLHPYSQSPSFGVPIGLPSNDGFGTLNLTSTIGDYTYSSPSFTTTPSARPYTPPDGASISGQTLGSVRSHRRKPSRSNDDSDEEDDKFQPHAPAAGSADS
jgi:hypothetical protein